MRFRIKDVGIATGGTLVAIINIDDALQHDLHYEDRVMITFGKSAITAILDISESASQVPRGHIGLMEEVLSILKARNGDYVELEPESPPASVQYIKNKLNGRKLSYSQIDEIIRDIVNNRLSPVEMTYFVAACYNRGLSKRETVDLTKAIVNNGEVFRPKSKIVVDKHCIGGVPGNRTTMIVVPIIAAAGLTIPKTSSRSITSPAGTADTMEVLADVSIPLSKLKKVVEKTNGCMIWGGAFSLAAADDKLIRLRHPLSLDPVGMVLASVLAKKYAVSATHVLIDIPVGRGAKIENMKDAKKFKYNFEDIGRELGMKVRVIITDGSQPIGNGIGPALEARDVLWVLRNDVRGPHDLIKKSLDAAGEIFEMVGTSRKGGGRALASELLYSGAAYRKMVEIINAQGPKITEPSKIRLAKHSVRIKAIHSGIITHIDNKTISKIAWSAGAPIDKAAGLYLYKHFGDRVKKGETLFTLYANSREKLDFSAALAAKNSGFEIE